MQDWDLVIWDVDDPEIFIELAVDPECPNRSYFLRCLYGRIGDEVRTRRFVDRTWSLVERSVTSADPTVSTWASRSLALRSDPELFAYDDWCDGGLSRSDAAWP